MVLALPVIIVGEATAVCVGGRFLVEGDPVIAGGVAWQDGLTIARQVSLDSGCSPTDKVSIRHGRKGTKMLARWSSCDGIAGPARLRATIDSACESIRGTFVARRARIRRSVRAMLSTCGDTILDPRNGEQCEAGTDCVGGTCVECRCVPPTTTSVTTTTGTPTSTASSTTTAESTSTTSETTTTTEATTTTETTTTETTTTTEATTSTETTTTSTTTTTTLPVCSDGTVNGTESCDDGNLVDGDDCDSNCTPTACGNGIVTSGEECDDGNVANFDGCDSLCVVECGNGVLDPAEHCDDGNATDGDGCNTDCTITPPDLLYYAFDGSGTSVTNDASAPPPGTSVATLQGGLTQGPGGLCGDGAVIGTGVSSTTDYVNTGWAPDRGTGAWTISFRTSDIGPSATLFYIFGDANSNSFRCFTNGVAGSNNWILRGAGLTDVIVAGGATVAPSMTTFVYDPAQSEVRGYVNGARVSTVLQGAVDLTGTGPFKVVGYASNVGLPASASIDEFRLYGRALTDQEVASLYTWTNACPITITTTTITSTTTTTLPPHCGNEIMDGDESGIDCGGSCPPCGP